MLKASVHASIADIDPARWDAVPGDPLSTHAVLTALEGAGLPGVRLRYAVLEDSGGCWRAVAPLARVDVDGGRLTRGPVRRTIEQVRRLRPSFLHTSAMILGTPLSVGNPPARVHADPDPRPLWADLGGLLQEIADEERSPWRIIKEFPERDAATAASALAGLRWTMAPSESGFLLPLNWRSYDAYLGSLRSAYRYKIRKAARALELGEIEIDVPALGDVYDEGLHTLYDAVVDRATVVFERLTPAFFTAFGRTYGADAPLVRFRRDGRVVGWVAMFFADGTAYDLFHGIDYEENARSAIYYNQLAAVIRLALERGARRLSMGQTTAAAKMRFGAIPQARWVAVRHRSGIVSAALRAARGLLFPVASYPELHVFGAPASVHRGEET